MGARGQNVTLAHVASHCGVSVATVSRSLHNNPLIHPDTRRAVQRAARRLGYCANAVARSLVRGRSNIIAMAGFFSNASNGLFWTDMARLVRRTLGQRHYLLMACTVDEEMGSERELFESLISQMVAGILWIPSKPEETKDIAALTRAAGVPLVILDQSAEGCDVSFVHSDNGAGAAAAMRHVIAQGHRRIACLTGPLNYLSMRQRLAGGVSAAREAGIEPLRVVTGFTYEAARDTARELLSRPDRPTAVLASMDDQAWGVLDAARELGLRVPQDLRVIGYGDYIPPHYTRCQLSTVSQRREEMIEAAIAALMDSIQEDRGRREIVTPVELLIRDT
ncbi:MAG TPA: LacI family DNA-binding transcriptional regulator [Candidatus Brocadiia bacterium]|nr:LacI family DNA-binding transcriptional regulator [Candidatus Brocadiia bacterium]